VDRKIKEKQLEAAGLRVVDEVDEAGQVVNEDCLLFVRPALVQEKLLAHTRFAGGDLGQLLERLDGRQRGKRRLSGRQLHGILLPLALVLPEEEPAAALGADAF